MADWISQLKEHTEEENRNKRQEEQKQDHERHEVDTNLGRFFREVREQTKQQAARISEEFPDKSEYQCEFSTEGDSFRVRQPVGHVPSVEVRLDMPGRCIKFAITAAGGNPSYREFSGHADDKDHIYLLDESNTPWKFSEPQDVAEAIVKIACGIEDGLPEGDAEALRREG